MSDRVKPWWTEHIATLEARVKGLEEQRELLRIMIGELEGELAEAIKLVDRQRNAFLFSTEPGNLEWEQMADAVNQFLEKHKPTN